MIFQRVNLRFLRLQRAPGGTMPPVGKSPSRVCLLAPKGPGCRGLSKQKETPSWKKPTPRPHRPSSLSGEKAKARDIVAAIRTLQTVEQEKRPATADERQIARPLRRLRGRGPVDLSRSGDRPVQGRRLAGPRRRAQIPAVARGIRLAPNAPPSPPFYTSPVVIAAMHEAIGPARRPAKRDRPGAGLRHGQFHGPCPGRAAIHRRRAGFASPAASPAPCTRKPTSASRTSATPSCPPHRRRDRQRAVRRRRLDYPRHEAVRCTISSSPSPSTPSNPAACWPSSPAITRSTSRTPPPASTWPTRPISSGRSACRPTPSRREGTRVVTDIVFLRKRAAGAGTEPRRSRMAAHRPARRRRRRQSRSTAIS